MLDRARQVAGASDMSTDIERTNFQGFLMERVRHLMQVRGLQYEEIQAVTSDLAKVVRVSPADLFDRAAALGKERHTPGFESVAEAFKRANNIVDSAWGSIETRSVWGRNSDRLSEPAEVRLKDAIKRVGAEIDHALASREPHKAFTAIGSIQPELASFFSEVRVMVDDQAVQDARLSLLAELRDRIAEVGDISVLAPRQS
jgi:glycyl-tRNA synthetase beta chain